MGAFFINHPAMILKCTMTSIVFSSTYTDVSGINMKRFKKELKYVLNSREEFERVRSILDTEQVEDDVKRAAFFYQLIRYSYASGAQLRQSAP